MELKVQVSFQQLLTMVKTLTPSQKAKLRAELNEEQVETIQQNDFIEYLLKGPVYNDKDIQMIEENGKSIKNQRSANSGLAQLGFKTNFKNGFILGSFFLNRVI